MKILLYLIQVVVYYLWCPQVALTHILCLFIYLRFTNLLFRYKGVDTNGSQFYISLNKNNQMNGRCVVFGRMIDGEETLKNIESTFTFKGVPARDIIVHSAGTLDR